MLERAGRRRGFLRGAFQPPAVHPQTLRESGSNLWRVALRKRLATIASLCQEIMVIMMTQMAYTARVADAAGLAKHASRRRHVRTVLLISHVHPSLALMKSREWGRDRHKNAGQI